MKRILKWLIKPVDPRRPQTAPIGVFLIVPIVVIYMNWPLSENTIELWEVISVLSMYVLLLFCLWFKDWYNNNKNM